MNQVVCRIVFSDGLWERTPSEDAVRTVLRPVFPSHADARFAGKGPSLAGLEFDEPEDGEALVAVAVVLTRYCHAEIIRDDIIEALLNRFGPEYDSMVDVEVLDE